MAARFAERRPFLSEARPKKEAFMSDDGSTPKGVDRPEIQKLIEEIRQGGAERLEREPSIKPIAFCNALGMRLLATGEGEALMAVPYRPELIGDPDSGVIHGGVVTTLLDTAAGLAASMAGGGPEGLATLDLRIDYMRPAEPGKVIFASARCFRRARQISFMRATAFNDRDENAIAVAVGAFMHGSKVNQGEKPRQGGDAS